MSLPPGWVLELPITAEAAAINAYYVGFRGDALVLGIAIPWAESSLIPNQRNVNDDGSIDRGIWQFNSRFHPEISDYECDVITTAWYHAYEVSNGGTDFSAWNTFTNGAYRRYLDQARAAATAIEARNGAPGTLGTDPSNSPPAAPQPVTPGPPTADYLPPSTNGPSPTWVPSRFIDGFKVQGNYIAGDVIGAAAVSGHVDLDTAQVSQIDLQFPEPRGDLTTADRFALRTPVDWYDLRLRVAAVEWASGGAGGAAEQLTVTCRPAGAEKMREYDALGRSVVFSDMSPTEVMSERTGQAGLIFVGKGTVRRPQITRHGKGDTQQDQTESDWDLGERLADEEGFWAFEAAGVYYFAPPSWLVKVMANLSIRWQTNEPNMIEPLECPTARQTTDVKPGQVDVRTMTMKLAREIGEQVRPGMSYNFYGLPGFGFGDQGGPDGFDGFYVITKVSWDLDGGISPVTIEGTQPVDPIPKPSSDNASDDTSSPTGGSRFPTTPVTGGKPSALDFVTVALSQIGKPYVYGAETDPNDPDPAAFDCSELVQWALARVGVDFVDGSYAQLAAVDRITVDQAKLIRGALMFPQPDAHHVVISLGDGEHTVEAMGRAYGVVQGNIGNRFGAAGLVPGLDYGVTR